VYSNTRIVPKYRAAPWTFVVKSVLPVAADQATLNSISFSRQIHSQIKTTSRRAMDANRWRYDASSRRDSVGGAVERSYVGGRRRLVTQWGASTTITTSMDMIPLARRMDVRGRSGHTAPVISRNPSSSSPPRAPTTLRLEIPSILAILRVRLWRRRRPGAWRPTRWWRT
jgi:hypothetical protein